VHGVGVLSTGNMLFVGACLAGGLAASLAGYVVGFPSLRLRGDYLAIVTLGFGEIIRVIIQLSNDVMIDPAQIRKASWATLASSVGGSVGFSGLPYYTNLFWVYFFVALMLAVAYRLKYSSYGRSFLAIREDEKAAEALGVPVFKYKVRAFVIAAFFAGVGGALYAHEIGTQLQPKDLSFMKSIEVVILVVLRGMGSVSGAVLAAIILTILPEELRFLANYRLIIYSLMLIMMMIMRPQGLCGIHEIWEMPWLRRLWTKRRPAT
jgi:branched-chain amino acid transport system permease protein